MKLDIFQTALRMVYPPHCILCRTVLDRTDSLCGSCWRDMPFVAGHVCDCCGIPLVGDHGLDDAQNRCDDCITHPKPWDRGRAALVYQGNARKLVLALKHGDRQDIAIAAGHWMAKAAVEMVDDQTVIVPIPLHWRRKLQRRYNQADLLAQRVGDALGLSVIPNALTRPNPTIPLEDATYADRHQRLEHAFALNDRICEKLRDKTVVIVDDVMTSGATLSAATSVLRTSHVRHIHILVLARVPLDN